MNPDPLPYMTGERIKVRGKSLSVKCSQVHRILRNSRTNSLRWQAILALATFLAVAPALWAQNSPRIGYVYPAGGRQGTTFQVTVGGQFLNGTTNAYVFGTGVQAAVVEYIRPLTQKEVNDLREKMKELQDKRAAVQNSRRNTGQTGAQSPTNVVWTAADQKMVTEIREKLAAWQRKRDNPVLAETVTLRITMAPNAEPGERELRLGTPAGLSNPLLFCVGQLPEFHKKEPTSNNAPARGRNPGGSNEPQATAPTEMHITIPAVVNGQIMPGGVDRYRFKARKGQRLVVAASARGLIPYLADAVPGWFQAALALYDANGNELQYADHFRFDPDPVLFYEVPDDGEYVVQIRDSIYRGREDFVYRVTVGELPYVMSIFPLGGPVGTQTTIELTGWNLPDATLTLTNKVPGVYPISVRGKERISNHVPYAVDALPECREQEPNNSQETAQPVTLPVIVNGRIDQPGEWDVFRFEGRAGDAVVAEVYARRLDSPLDSVLKLTDATGNQLAFNDDHDDKGAGLDTHYADSWLRATLPTNGTYYLYLGDAQHQGGPEYAYRLRISPPLPDFALRVVPSSINVRAGMSVPLTVYALRKDGFTGEIALALRNAPAGFALSGGKVLANQDKVRLTLTAPPTSLREPLSLSVEGRAVIQGWQIVRPGVPADDVMQAFAYRHLVPAKELEVAVSGRFMAGTPVKILDATPIRIPAGGTALVRVATAGNAFMSRVQFELNEPPEGIGIQKVSPTGDGAEILLYSDAAKAKPGLKGNLIVAVVATNTPAPPARGNAPANQRRASMGTLPAIPFEIVKK
jgi:hypothetical protein